MGKQHNMRSLVFAAAAAGLLISAPALATASAHGAVPSCGGDKGEKDTKKPKPDDDQGKREPASVDALCGGDKGEKDTKKPKPDDDKLRPIRPDPGRGASSSAFDDDASEVDFVGHVDVVAAAAFGCAATGEREQTVFGNRHFG